jgi:hypothetical protein
MGAIYLDGIHAPSLLEVVAATGVPTTGYSGWQTRSRGSGGYDAPGPIALVVHHTASPARSTPGQQFANDASYCAVGHADAPVANMVLGPEGQVSVHAAGASNHAGDGGPWSTSRGTIPASGANSRSIAVEASNDGQGQPWSLEQQDAYVAISAAMCSAYGFDPARRGPTASDLIAHYEWAGPSPPAPGRKCDPAGPSRWSGPSGGCNARNYWRMDEFRAAVAAYMANGPQPPEPEVPMIEQLIAPVVSTVPNAAWFVRWDGGRITWASNADTLLANRQGVAVDSVTMGADQYQRLLNDATVGWPDSARVAGASDPEPVT